MTLDVAHDSTIKCQKTAADNYCDTVLTPWHPELCVCVCVCVCVFLSLKIILGV
jgi:hypothetical protein